jgi:hypothetical protein
MQLPGGWRDGVGIGNLDGRWTAVPASRRGLTAPPEILHIVAGVVGATNHHHRGISLDLALSWGIVRDQVEVAIGDSCRIGLSTGASGEENQEQTAWSPHDAYQSAYPLHCQ